MGQYYEANHRSFTADAAYNRGIRVKMSGSLANTITVAGANDIEIGTLTAATSASGTIPGLVADVLLRSANGTQEYVASGAITVNAIVYPDVNGLITATPNGIPIGRALNSASASGDFVEVLVLDVSGGLGKLFVGVSTTDTVTNTVTETPFAQSYTVPANVLNVGDRIRIHAAGTVTSHNSTDTLNVKLYVGGNVIASTGAVNNAANDTFDIFAEVVVRTITSSGTIVASGTVTDGVTGTATTKQFLFASATLDSTIAELIKVSATWSVASASDIVRLDILNIDRLAA